MESSREFIERKKELLGKLEEIRQKDKNVADALDKEAVVVFAEKSGFIEGLIGTIEKKHRVRFFSNAEEASAFCIKYKSNHIILDMDQPTDWKNSTDVFTTVRTVHPEAHFILSTKNPGAVPVQTLAAQKAEVLAYPFSSDILFRKLKNGPPV